MARPVSRRRKEGVTPRLLMRDAEEVVSAQEARLIPRGTAIRLLVDLIEKAKSKHPVIANRIRKMLFDIVPEGEELFDLTFDPKTRSRTDIYDISGLSGFLGWIHSGGVSFPVFRR
jgi:hypothetical protein